MGHRETSNRLDKKKREENEERAALNRTLPKVSGSGTKFGSLKMMRETRGRKD